MKRILAISDIHGEFERFEQLLNVAQYNSDTDQLILLGDYVDRGPDSCAVLNKVMKLKDLGAIVLRGNHDDMMVAAADHSNEGWERWGRNGAIQTLKSYDASIESMEIPDSELFRKHVSFIKSLDYYYETDEYIFVHAGVHPTTPLHETEPSILIWIREEFHKGYTGEKTVVFGHTRTTLLHGIEDHSVYFGNNNIIGIDGGAVFGGNLNCLELHTKKVYCV